MSTTNPDFAPTLDLRWAEEMHTLGSSPPSTAAATIASHQDRLDALTKAHPDDRLHFLMSAECGFNTEHIRQVTRAAGEVLDTSAKRRIRELVSQALDDGGSPKTVVDQWFTDEQRDRLRRILNNLEVPDTFMVACYLWLKIHDTAHASYLRHLRRRQPRPDFASLKRTPGERADDLRWANAV